MLFGGRYLPFGSGSEGRSDSLEELALRQPEYLDRLNQMVEERAQTNQQIILGQFFLLDRFRRLADVGLAETRVVTASSLDSDLAAARSGRGVPRVAVDLAAREEWTQLASELEGVREGVDERIFDAYEAVREFSRGHPWPSGGMAGLQRSDWAQPGSVDQWNSLNKALQSLVTGAIERAY